MKKLLFTIFLSLTFASKFAYGCSLMPTPLTDFDQSEYIFIGDVVGYTNPLKFNRKQNYTDSELDYELKFSQANGLIVKVKEFINLPKTPKTHFEVIPFNVGSICETLGYTKLELEKYYPKGTEILVIANEAKIFSYKLENGNFRLEERKARSIVTPNADKSNVKRFVIKRIYDYQKNSQPKEMATDDYYISRFEMRKDLLRLKNAATQKERDEIINRILYSYKSYYFVDLYSVFKKYVLSSAEAEELYKRHLQFSGFSDHIIQEEVENRHKLEQNKNLKRKN